MTYTQEGVKLALMRTPTLLDVATLIVSSKSKIQLDYRNQNQDNLDKALAYVLHTPKYAFQVLENSDYSSDF